MSKNYEFKEQLLQDSETEILLKKFLSKVDSFMGEDFAISTITTKSDIAKSLSEYTCKFEKARNKELEFILLRSAVLSNDKGYFIRTIKEKVLDGELKEALEIVGFSYEFKKQLAKNLIRQSKTTDKELYNSLENKNHVIEDLDNLKFYENIIQKREKESRIIVKSR